MDIEKLRQLRLAQPFKSFNLLLKDGSVLPVERATYMAISPNGRRLAYAKPKGGFAFLSVDDVSDAVVDEMLATPWKRVKG